MKTITLPDGRTVQILEEGDEPLDIGGSGLRRAASDVAQGQGGFQRFMGGAGGGLQSVATGIDELIPGNPLQRASAAVSQALGMGGIDPIKERLEAAKGYLEGGGWEATAGDITGKIAATAPIPANALSRIPGLASLAARAPRLAQVIGTMLTAGGVAGATTPGGLEERGEAAGMAAALSGVVPAATGAMQATRRATTGAGKALSRAELIRERIGRGDEDAVLAALRGSYPGSKIGVQPTAGMITQNPAIQQIEAGARSKSPYFAQLNQANAQARWDALNKIAGDETQLAALEKARSLVSDPARKAALLSARLKGGDFLGRLGKTADDVLLDPSSTGADAAVVRLVQSRIQDKLERGLNDPAALYAIRKDLTEGYRALGPDAAAAIKGATRTRNSLIKAIDEILDESSSGAWSKYMDSYQKASGPITSMKAAQTIRRNLENPAFPIPQTMGEAPAPVKFGQQIKQHGTKQFGSTWKDRLQPKDREMLEEIARDLGRQADVMKGKGMLGSHTAPLMAAQDVAEDIGANLVGQGVGAAVGGPIGATLGGMVTAAGRKGASTARDRALAEVLQDPARLADLIEKARRAERILGATTQTSRAARTNPPMD